MRPEEFAKLKSKLAKPKLLSIFGNVFVPTNEKQFAEAIRNGDTRTILALVREADAFRKAAEPAAASESAAASAPETGTPDADRRR